MKFNKDQKSAALSTMNIVVEGAFDEDGNLRENLPVLTDGAAYARGAAAAIVLAEWSVQGPILRGCRTIDERQNWLESFDSFVGVLASADPSFNFAGVPGTSPNQIRGLTGMGVAGAAESLAQSAVAEFVGSNADLVVGQHAAV